MGGDVTKEQDIIQAQYLDLVYSQSVTLYDFIPNDPHPSTDPTKPPVDGVVATIQPSSTAKTVKPQSTSTTTSSTHTVSTKLNAIQSSQTPNNKNKGKGHNKKPGS